MDTHRIVAGGNVTTAIRTQSHALELNARRMELKRERLAAGANRIAAEGGQWDGTGQDYVEAIGEALMQTALNVDSSRQVAASETLLRETGLGERTQPDTQQARLEVGLDASTLAAVALLLDAVAVAQAHDVVDAVAVDV
jgi:hypothetical protein